MTRLLVSVVNVEEALQALEAGADFIDLKNPVQGALGALPLPVIREVVQAVGGQRPVSATIGDLPMQPDLVAEAVAATAATGVDIVKIGFFGHSGYEACIEALAPLVAKGVRLVAVLFADAEPDFSLPNRLSEAGFHGVMLDTSTKDGGRLGDWLSDVILRDFVENAHRLRLLSGLAGSLEISGIPKLVELGPDYLGFRGGLCHGSHRSGSLDAERLRKAAELLHLCNIPDRVCTEVIA